MKRSIAWYSYLAFALVIGSGTSSLWRLQAQRRGNNPEAAAARENNLP